MARILLMFPALLWLIAPAGICVCKLPRTLFASSAAGLAEDTNSDQPADDEEEEEDHAPGCPARKMPVFQDAVTLFDAQIPLNLSSAYLSPPDFLEAAKRGFHAHFRYHTLDSEQARFLTVLTLRI